MDKKCMPVTHGKFNERGKGKSDERGSVSKIRERAIPKDGASGIT